MENQDFLQLSTVNSSIPNLGQHQSNLLPSDLIQPPDTNLNRSGSFSDQTKAEIADIRVKVVDYNQYVHEREFGKSTSEFLAHTTTSEISTISDNSDPLTGNITSVNGEAVLDLAVTDVKQRLKSFTTGEEFFDKMNLAFGDDRDPQEAHALIQDLVTGEAMPKIEILPDAILNANGAFGEGTIYLSEKYLSENVANPEAVAGVLLEEIGHYVDQELNSVDSPGDEGDIFARLVQGETIDEAELTALKAEDDSATIPLNRQEIPVELAGDPTALIPIPLDFNGVPINEGLTSPSVEFMQGLLGIPGELDSECEGIDGVTNSELRQLMIVQDVGPFEVIGIKPAVEALQRIFDKVKEERPDLYDQLTEAGTLCVRGKKTVEGEVLPEFSNHSWGTTIDIEIGDLGYDLDPDGQTYQGLVDLYPYFNAEGFYWGAAFETNEDPIHFEASEELLTRWETEGQLTPSGEQPLPPTQPYQSWLLQTGTVMPQTAAPTDWDYLSGDYNKDGTTDLFGIVKNGTGTGTTEVHVLDGFTADISPFPPPDGGTPDPLYPEYSGEMTESSELSPNMRAFLDTIAYGEGTYRPEGYRVIVGYIDEIDSFEDHPNVYNEELNSTAAGRYQFLYDTWEGAQSALGLPDFSPVSQDLGAVHLIEGEGAVESVEAGNFEDAVYAVNNIWASLPGSPYGQPTKDLEELQAFYGERLAAYGVV